MQARQDQFVREWGDALRGGTAAAFIGSGASLEANYPSWPELMKERATELGITLRAHDDLTVVAQHYLNLGESKRSEIKRWIADQFPEGRRTPAAIRVLARLPLRTLWTTNYDRLLEAAWRERGLILDAKKRQSDLAHPKANADAVLYKMHGCASDPDSLVIAKDDYDLYLREREAFSTALAADLMGRRMLFLGFGHNDPNLAFLFSMLRRLFPSQAAQHFSIGRQPSPEEGESADEARARYELWCHDWEQRYRVRRVDVAEWSDVPTLLERVERRVVADAVLVSGSYPVETAGPDRTRIETVASSVGSALAESGRRLVSGFGLTVGSSALSGFLQALGADALAPERRLLLRPFPQPTGSFDPRDLWPDYRMGLVRSAGAVVFVGGARTGDAGVVDASGVMAEFDACLALGRVPIPVGGTGYASRAIWSRMGADLGRWPWYPRDAFDVLGDPAADASTIARAVTGVLDEMRSRGS
ncbi:SIR2 family protein [Pararoseomonas sp. SCSIO 73927]|uniref:SIR2 family protein n=1 Tax=Pararoseomonas sp. SCSIO 73927 TaxID=3114537 RepID=UPI0030CE54A9